MRERERGRDGEMENEEKETFRNRYRDNESANYCALTAAPRCLAHALVTEISSRIMSQG